MENIKYRIQELIELEGLSLSQFAEKIGISASSLSHTLSGRNKPNLESISKILKELPYLNAEWLILGKGNLKKQMIQGQLFLDDNISQKNSDLISDLEDNNQEKADSERSENGVKKNISDNVSNTPQKIDLKQEENTSLENRQQNQLGLSSDKHIQQIIITYTDNTFDILKPN